MKALFVWIAFALVFLGRLPLEAQETNETIPTPPAVLPPIPDPSAPPPAILPPTPDPNPILPPLPDEPPIAPPDPDPVVPPTVPPTEPPIAPPDPDPVVPPTVPPTEPPIAPPPPVDPPIDPPTTPPAPVAPPTPPKPPAPIPAPVFLAGPEAVGSNLGVQEIVQVLRAPGTATGPAEDGKDHDAATGAPSKFSVSSNAGVRAYRTSNLMRFENDPQGAGVLEFSLGANLMTPSFPLLGKEVEPSLTLMTQRAYYGQFRPAGGDVEKENVKNFMDYEFRMLNLAGSSQVSKEWRVTGAVDYNELHNFRSGQKMFHSFSPIFSISRMKALSETSMLAMDANVRYAFTEQVLPYAIDGVFEDDGDNWQSGLNLTYVKAFGPEGRFMILPSLGFTRTHYVKNTPAGRVDYLLTAGVSAMYSLTKHIGIQAFLTYGNKTTNSKGRTLLGESSKYENVDLGIGLTGQYAF